MGNADGQKKKLPLTGELITTREGIPLMVLGRPAFRDPGPGDLKLMRMLRGTLVVMMPDGSPALHVPDTHASRPDFINPWELGWTPIDEDNCWEPLHDTRPPARRRPK